MEQQVVPAFTKFKQFFVSEYLPACYGQVGAWQLPHGGELYAQMIRHYTTTNMTPEEVHQTGLKEVARINQEMDRVMQQTGFKGSRDEFFKFLRTDPQFFYKTPEELFEAYKALAKTVDPNLVKVFRTLPRELAVEAIPGLAPDTTAAYYRPGAADGSRAGTYFSNLYKPDARPKREMTALSLHESVPGHHLQIARAHELGEMPKFRRFGEYTAFVEGWGLYAESLGEDDECSEEGSHLSILLAAAADAVILDQRNTGRANRRSSISWRTAQNTNWTSRMKLTATLPGQDRHWHTNWAS